MASQLISQEEFASVQQAQAGITRLFAKAAKHKKLYRIIRNQQPLGMLIPNNLWNSLVEDLEALSSPSYLQRIKRARNERGGITLVELKKKYSS